MKRERFKCCFTLGKSAKDNLAQVQMQHNPKPPRWQLFCYLEEALHKHNLSKYYLNAKLDMGNSYVYDLINKKQIPLVSTALIILNFIKEATGKKYEVEDIWKIKKIK